MKKIFICFLLLFISLSTQAQTACSEEELNLKREQLIHFRIYALQGQEKLSTYTQIGSGIVADFSSQYIEYEKNKKEGQVYLNQMCSIMDQLNIMSDDLLAGGDGKGQKTPWLKQNPKAFFKIVKEFETYCATSQKCNENEGRKIQEQLESLPKRLIRGNNPAELIDEYYDSVSHFLSQKEENEMPKSE